MSQYFVLVWLYICIVKNTKRNQLFLFLFHLFMKNYTLAQRNTDFMQAVRTCWKNMAAVGKTKGIDEIIMDVISGPAPEFYVTYETAYRYVSLARRGMLPQSLTRRRRQMWLDLNRRVHKIMKEKPEWCYGRALVEAIDMGNAPSWYLDARYARQLYYKLLREGTVRRRTLFRNRDLLKH